MAWEFGVSGNLKGRPPHAPTSHGTPARYRKGCRCDACHMAYAEQQRDRRTRRKLNQCDWVVSADFARQHLLDLRRLHVGKRAVRDCTGISDLVLAEIASGKRTRIRQSTEERIMRVTEAGRAARSRVEGKATTRLIDELVGAGYSKKGIARRLGYKDLRLFFYRQRFITAHNAMRVEKLHTSLMKESHIDSTLRLVAQVESLRKHLRKAA